MAVLRLFANLRELAGASRVEIEGSTVDEVLKAAVVRFGPGFAASIETAAVWRNGEVANPGDVVAPDDEVAVLPPVSGGGEVMARGLLEPSVLTGVIALLLLVGTNVADGPAWWAAALVAVAAGWIVDLSVRLELRGRQVATYGMLAVVVLSSIATHALGGVGLGMTVFLAVGVTLVWGVALASYRRIEEVAPAMVVSLIAGAAVGSLMLTRTVFQPGAHAISIFLLAVTAATITGWFLDQMRAPPLDPYAGTALASVFACAVGALLWDQDLIGYLLIGLGLAVALVAGRSLGSILRTGRVTLAESAPGAMAGLDGAILAAAVYYPIVGLVL
ncbi:MAG: MoaD/ThiS family protein [Actinomycetota bacterium]